MIKKLFSILKRSGLEVYLPSKKTGKPTGAYVVIAEEKSEPGLTGMGIYTYFSIKIVSPLESYNSLEETQEKVKTALLNSSFKFHTSETEEVKSDDGFVRTLTYRRFKRCVCR